MSEYIIEAQNIVYQYPDGTKALKGITMKIEKGKKIAILGSNGAGKSTLFLHLNGILKPSKGKIFFKEKEVKYNHSALMELRKNVGIVFQDPETQLFSASVYGEVSFGAINLKLSENVVRDRVDKALLDTGVYHLKDKATHFLSYGQKKRVSIADILVMGPEVVIFDEPTASLDPKHTLRILDLFDDINKQGTTIILSTHDVDAAYGWADYFFIMKDGVVVKEGLPEEVFQDDELLDSTELVKPYVLEIFNELQKAGYIPDDSVLPKGKEELLRMIRQNS